MRHAGARRVQGHAVAPPRVLREAGVTHTRPDGTRRHVSLRREDLDERFPGLLDALLAAAAAA